MKKEKRPLDEEENNEERHGDEVRGNGRRTSSRTSTNVYRWYQELKNTSRIMTDSFENSEKLKFSSRLRGDDNSQERVHR